MRRVVSLLTLTAALAASAPAAASTIAPGFDNQDSLPACDDCFSAAVMPGFALNFFGTTYSDIYASNNGYVTFSGGQGVYTPVGLGAGYVGLPIIAPFFADVDTRSGLGSTTWGTGSFAGRPAWGTNWLDTGYFSVEGDKRNSFQLILTDRSDVGAGDFDIYFNYGQIQWETGGASGGIGGLGGSSASVGFNAAQGGAAGTFYELPGSLVPGSFIDSGTAPLVRTTNIGVPGRLLFQVRNGSIIVPPPGGVVPEPATWAMLITGFGLVGHALRRRRLQAA